MGMLVTFLNKNKNLNRNDDLLSLMVEKEAIFITSTQQTLVALAQQGDEQAFYQLIEQEQISFTEWPMSTYKMKTTP